MLDLTFLSEEQIFGDNQLDIIKKYGTKSAITDFAILSGGFVYDTIGGKDLKNRTGRWWTRLSDGYNDARVINFRDVSSSNRSEVNLRFGGIRPAFTYSSIQPILSSRVRENSGIKEVEYGEYPQWVVDENYSRELEEVYNNGSLRTTGKNYTTDSVVYYDSNTPFSAGIHAEYEYNGNKYIRFVINDSNFYGNRLSDGRTIKFLKPFWVRVEPIIWLVDEKADIALSKYIILSGIQFDDKEYKGDFENTFIKRFMDEYLSKEIECGVYKEKLIENKQVDIDSIFDDVIKKMNEINEVEEVKTKVLK